MFLNCAYVVDVSKIGQQCKSPTGSGRIEQSLTVGGISRKYSLYVPSSVTYPAALLVAWHGISSSPNDIESKMKLTQYANSLGFILVYPEAKNKGASSLLSPVAFNGAGCCKVHRHMLIIG